MLNHAFILEKERGCALISESVSILIDEINKYRIERFNPDNESSEEEDESNNKNEEDQENKGETVINNDDDNNYTTKHVNDPYLENNTLQLK